MFRGRSMFSPPLAADTLLPSSDRACREIVEYLRDALNEDYCNIRDLLDNPIFGDNPVVVGIREWNAWSNNFNDFPLLCVYRRGSVGLELCEATVIYYLPSLAVQDEKPGLLRWVETRIVRGLERLATDWRGGPVDALHVNVLLDPKTRTEYGFSLKNETTAFPFVAIDFSFEEIGV